MVHQGLQGGLSALLHGDLGRAPGLAHCQRRLGGDELRQLEGAIEELLRGGDLLDESDAVGLVGVESLARQEIPHAIAPARELRKAERRAAEGHDSSADLHLGELRAPRREPDVRGEEQLHADGQAVTLDGADHRLGAARLGYVQWIDDVGFSAKEALAAGYGRSDLCQIEAGGEVLAVSVEQGAPKLVVPLEGGVRRGELVQHLDIERVHFFRPIEADQKQVAPFLGGDGGFVAHRCAPPAAISRRWSSYQTERGTEVRLEYDPVLRCLVVTVQRFVLCCSERTVI